MAKIFEIFERIFTVLCILLTFGFVCWCFYEYHLDLDLSLISLKEFGEDDNIIMPEMSLCFFNPFLTEKFNNGDLRFNVSYLQYKDFLLGKTWDDRMLDIDFGNVTKRFEDYLIRYDVVLKNGSHHTYKSTSSIPEFIKKPHPTFVGPFYGKYISKCYGIHIPMNVQWFGLAIKRDIFPGGIRPIDKGLSVSLHYPNQFFRSFDNEKRFWPIHIQSPNQSLCMILTVNMFEVTQRRNSRKQKCNKNWKEYDLDVARKHFENIQCRQVYGIWDSNYPICNSSEKMAMALSYGNRPQIMEPCQSADKIVFAHEDYYLPAKDYPADCFSIWVNMKNARVKLIEQKRAYEFQTLVGNSGGYIGLFLGTFYFHTHTNYTLGIKTFHYTGMISFNLIL